jgi:hypothetical protein
LCPDSPGADIFQSVHGVLKGHALVLLLPETLFVAAEAVALAFLDILLDTPEAVFVAARLALYDFCSIGEGEEDEGGNVGRYKAVVGKVVPDDGEDSAERAANSLGVRRNLLVVGDVTGRVNGGVDMALREVPDGLLDQIVV